MDKENTGQDQSLDTTGIAAPATVTYPEAASDLNNGTGTATIEANQDDPIQHTKNTVTDPTMTHCTTHTTNHPHTTAHQVVTLRTAIDHIHTHPTDCQIIIHTKEDHTIQDCTPIRDPDNHTLVRLGRSI